MPQVNHRERLLAGAITCLQERGYANTTARDIAAAADANLASIGYHFGSKEALLDEALIRILDQRNQYVSALTFDEAEGSPIERMTRAFEAVRSLFEPFRPVLVAFVEALARAEHSPELRDRMAAHYRETRSAVATMVETSLGRSASRLRAEPAAMATFVMAAFDGLVLQFLLDPEQVPEGAVLVDAFADWMSLALGRSPRPKATAASPRKTTGRARPGARRRSSP